MQNVWMIAAGLGGIALLIGLSRFFAQIWPEARSEDLPTTPLERLGWVGLWVTAGVGITMAVLVAVNGATDFYENDTTRGIFTVVLMVGLAVWAGTWRKVKGRERSAVVDERDRAILARSFSVESVLVILSLVAWTVSLTEIFWDDGAIPIGYLQLLFWSTFILGAFGRSLGIVLGYRREPRIDA